MKKPRTLVITALFVALVSSLFLPAFSAVASSQPEPARLHEFTEMLPGVFVSWRWWNQTSIDWESETDHSGSYQQEYLVMDVAGNVYLIRGTGEYSWERHWAYTALRVTILLDPDRSFMRWVQSNPNAEDADFERPRRQVLTGDEVIIHSILFYHEHHLSYSYNATYTWYDDEMVEVDPNTVIPTLHPRCSWAIWMNGTKTGSGTHEDATIGFDITEAFLIKNGTAPNHEQLPTLTWVQHDYVGLTAFNDTDNDGLIDLFTQTEDFYPGEEPVLEFRWLNSSESEFAYHLRTESASIGSVAFPHLNANNEIEWSMEFCDINGNLIPFERLFGSPQLLLMVIPSQNAEGIPTTLESLEFTCRFGVTREGAVLKVDQSIGDFHTPGTQDILPEVDGLSLALSYRSGFAFRHFNIRAEEGEVNTETLQNTAELHGGGLNFTQLIHGIFAKVEFGGTYVWGKDGATYDVGTVIIPFFGFHRLPRYIHVPRVIGYHETHDWVTRQVYYSSCYDNWDGYSITHDPIYTVFPAVAPRTTPFNGTWALFPALALSIIAIIAISVVIMRIRGVRKSI